MEPVEVVRVAASDVAGTTEDDVSTCRLFELLCRF